MLRLRHQAVRYSNIPAAPTRKRFYKEVSIEHVKNDEAKSSCYRIKLDNRNLKTVGGGQVFEVPSKVLALGVQAELGWFLSKL